MKTMASKRAERIDRTLPGELGNVRKLRPACVPRTATADMRAAAPQTKSKNLPIVSFTMGTRKL